MSQVITNAFEQYWQSCLAAEKPVVLDEFILADIPNLDITSPIDPETGLPPESQIVHRQNVDQRGRINNNAVAYTIVMDTTVGDFSFNAMYLRNKANGVIGMIVYKGRETKLKTDQTTGQTGNSLVKSMLMGYDQAAEATLTNVDAGTWQIDYAARLRGVDEDIRQLQADLYGHHTFVGDGFKVVEKDGAYQVTQGVAIVGGLRVELKAPEVIHPGTKPIGVWIDVHRAGSLLSEHQNHVTIITSVADLTDHVDSNGYQHYVAKLGTILADSTIEDGRGSAGGGSGGAGSIPDTFALWKRSMAEAGYNLIGKFGTEMTMESANQVVLSKSGNEVFAWLGEYPKIVSKDDSGEGNEWENVSDSLLIERLTNLEGDLEHGEQWGEVPSHGLDQIGRLLDKQVMALASRIKFIRKYGSDFSHEFEYEPATVGFRLKNSVLITDSPYKIESGSVSVEQEIANWQAFQDILELGIPIHIPEGVFVFRPAPAAVSLFKVYPNTFIFGAGRRHGVNHKGGTEIRVHCPAGGQLFESSLRIGQDFDRQGTFVLSGMSVINVSEYLGFSGAGDSRYYNPSPDAVLQSNTRAIWGSESAPSTDWGGYSDWRKKKDGAINIPFLMIKDVKLQNFTFDFDVHTWMASIEQYESYNCGPSRLYGTSVRATNCWPRNPIAHAWETRLMYSEISSSSLGENLLNGHYGGGLHNYGGAIKLASVGSELTDLTHIACFKGVVIVDGLEVVAGGGAHVVGKVYSADAFIIWRSLPKCVYSDGSQSEFANNWFGASKESYLKNHIIESPSVVGNFWGTTPWRSKIENYMDGDFVAPYATNPSGVIGSPFVKMPSVVNRRREVACAHLSFKDSVILRGVSQRIKFSIHGSFSDDVTSCKDENPRQKHGLLRLKVIPIASMGADSSAVLPLFKSADYYFSFSTLKEGTVKQEIKDGDGFSLGFVTAYFNGGVNNGGFDIYIGLVGKEPSGAYDKSAQCVVDIDYEGSYNNTNDSLGETINVLVL